MGLFLGLFADGGGDRGGYWRMKKVQGVGGLTEEAGKTGINCVWEWMVWRPSVALFASVGGGDGS